MKYLAIALVVAACGAHEATSNGGADAGSNVDAPTTQCDPSLGNACNGNDVVTCNPDGTYGSVVQSCAQGFACSSGMCQTACTADGVDLVYVVDEQNDFMSFDPRLLPANPFTKIGTLNCPTTGGTIQQGGTSVTPFSMSVDRDGVAWVLFSTGQIFNVSLTTAACTSAGNTVGASSMELFGMGFSTDTMGGMTEKLFLAGGGNNAQPNGKLAYDDTHGGDLTPTVVGTLSAQSDYSPELTGTNEAKLYGFYPEVTTNKPAYVQEIDKTSGAPTGMVWNLGSGPLSTVRDWAFAQWGGTFWVFVTTTDSNGQNPNSTVRSIDRASGTYTVVLQDLPYNIDGAGVSTCAPTVIQ
ncbi:MAG TPA: hypothetical protein VMJ10_21215 [Kofleriaceae bacterium]|nr:hypothetical protein [Kofleriaceae bacterium]